MLLLCLLHTPLRLSWAGLVLLASLWAVMTPRPVILIGGDGQLAAPRGPRGRLAVLHTARETFALKADGDARDVTDSGLHDGVRCDEIGCIG